MPEKMKKQLKKEAREKFGNTTSERARRYIYGTMQRKSNWKPGKSTGGKKKTGGKKTSKKYKKGGRKKK